MEKKIYIAFINNHFPPKWEQLAKDLQQCVPFPFAHIHPEIDLKCFFSYQRNQYYSTRILMELVQFLPHDGQIIIGITNIDIYIPILTFLFGEAQFQGRAALVSTYRLRNEFYGLPPDDLLLYDRTLKEVLHELGHVLGLVHCEDFECVMHSSTSVEDIDLKKKYFCKDCQEKLGINCTG